MKKSHILMAAWGASVAIIMIMPQLRSLVRFSANEVLSPTKNYDRMAMLPAIAKSSEDKFAGAIHASRLSVTSYSESAHSNLADLRDYCIAYPNDLEAAGIFCRRSMRQPYPEPGKQKETSKLWLSRSKQERLELLKIAGIAKKQNPQNWLWRLAEAYVYLHDADSNKVREVLTEQPLPDTYTDYAHREATRLEEYYADTFWGITPVQAMATHASIAFPNVARISELFDVKFRSISTEEQRAGAKCALDIVQSSEFFIGTLVARNMSLRLAGLPRNPAKPLKDVNLQALIDKSPWIETLPESQRTPFKKLITQQPKFDFEENVELMMAATHTHIPLMMGLILGCLALLSAVPWRPKLKYPFLTPVIIALSALPLSLVLGMNRGYWGEQNSFVSGFVDFNSAQNFMLLLTNLFVGIAFCFAGYRLVAKWKLKSVRAENAIALVLLLMGWFPSPIQFSVVLLGCLLATWDEERIIQPGVAAIICAVAFGIEYSLHPQQSQAYLATVPALLAVIASPRTRGISQLGWLGLGLVFASFLAQKITVPSLGSWQVHEESQLADYRAQLGLQATAPPKS